MIATSSCKYSSSSLVHALLRLHFQINDRLYPKSQEYIKKKLKGTMSRGVTQVGQPTQCHSMVNSFYIE